MSGNCPEPPHRPAAQDDGEPDGLVDRTVMVQAPTELGPYRLTKLLGRGGMGEVWQAFESNLERDVAVKLMRKELLANEEAVKRFAREARAVARLNHPNIVQVYAYGDQEGILYFVMELVEGETITQRMKRCGDLSLNDSVFMLLQSIEGLSYANARGIIHRDIKPSNLMLTPDYRIKIADFGLAKMVEQDTQMTAAGTTMGSPNYMSPEQARGEEADHRSDIYALGISWYQMLTGELPFTAQTAIGVLLKQIQDPLPEPEELQAIADGQVMEVIKKMCSKDPEERYQTYGGLAAAISAIAPDVRVKGSHIATTSMQAPQPAAQGTEVFQPDGGVTLTEPGREGTPSPFGPPPPPPALALPTPTSSLANQSSSMHTYQATAPVAVPQRNTPVIVLAAALVAIVGILVLGLVYVAQMNRKDQPDEPVVIRPTPAPATPVASPSPAATLSPAPTAIASPAPTLTPVAASPTPAEPGALTAVSTITPVTPAVPQFTPTPTPAGVTVLHVGHNSPTGVAVPVTGENGETVGSYPAGSRIPLVRLVRSAAGARYQVNFQGRLGYIAEGDGRTEVAAAGRPAEPTPTPAQILVLGVADSPTLAIPVYYEGKATREIRKLPPGTQVPKIGENDSMFQVQLPDKKIGWVLKVSARSKP